MKRIKLFEAFTEEQKMDEAMMSNIDIIAQEADSVEAFKKEVKEFLALEVPPY